MVEDNCWNRSAWLWLWWKTLLGPIWDMMIVWKLMRWMYIHFVYSFKTWWCDSVFVLNSGYPKPNWWSIWWTTRRQCQQAINYYFCRHDDQEMHGWMK